MVLNRIVVDKRNGREIPLSVGVQEYKGGWTYAMFPDWQTVVYTSPDAAADAKAAQSQEGYDKQFQPCVCHYCGQQVSSKAVRGIGFNEYQCDECS